LIDHRDPNPRFGPAVFALPDVLSVFLGQFNSRLSGIFVNTVRKVA